MNYEPSEASIQIPEVTSEDETVKAGNVLVRMPKTI